jgi:hypothetical protein
MSTGTVDANMRAALRTLLLAVEAATTGALTTISASGSVITRSGGSFVTDGFGVGDEIMASGFSDAGNNGRAMVTAITATTLTLDKSLTTASAGPAVTLSVGLPQGRAWEGFKYAPTVGQPFIEESFRPIDSRKIAVGPTGYIMHEFYAALSLSYPQGHGTLAVEKMAGAIRAALRPSQTLVYGADAGMIDRAARSPLVIDADWLRCPIQIYGHAHTLG